MSLPDHTLFQSPNAPDEQGAGPIFFERRVNGSLHVGGAATVAALEAAIASELLDDVTELSIGAKCSLPGLPANVTRLTALKHVWVESSAFVDWPSLYRLEWVERLTLGKDVTALGEGISAMRGLRLFVSEHAKHLTRLPSDFAELSLAQARVAAPLLDALVAATEAMPSFLVGLRTELGLKLADDSLTIGARSKYGARWQATSQAEVLRHLRDAGLLAGVKGVLLDAGSELEAWPADVPLPGVRELSVKSPAFRGWESLLAFAGLEVLVLLGSAGEGLDSVSRLSRLRELHLRGKGLAALPADLPEAPSLEVVAAPAKLRAGLAPFEEARRARRVTRALERFEAWLAEHAPDYLAGLAPGRTDFADAEAALGRPLPRELRALYAWRDGDRKEDGRFVFWRLFSPLAEALKRWSDLGAMARAGEWKKHGVQPPAVWSERWFPVLRWDNGWHLVVDLSGSWRGPAGQVIDVWMKDDDRTIRAPDLATYLEALVEALQRGVADDGDVALRVPPASAPGYPIRRTIRDAP
jgi:cell wall assembly regulator SMI1